MNYVTLSQNPDSREFAPIFIHKLIADCFLTGVCYHSFGEIDGTLGLFNYWHSLVWFNNFDWTFEFYQK